MGVLDNLEPRNVFRYFEEICGIPHGSGNIGVISDYLAKFAKERGLFCVQDEWKNVIIIKEAYPGYENQPPMILQGHMDMVAVKKPEASIHMERDGLMLETEGDWLYARDTSLGGDDGVAVAYGLALLAAEDIPHPRLEVIFTVDEETGMDGARNLDVTMLLGRRMLNLDSEEEGILLAGCAGGARVDIALQEKMLTLSGISYRLMVKGLRGGHSGVEIHKERGNAIHLLGRLLYRLRDAAQIELTDVRGGLADNAIPREAEANVLVSPEKEELLLRIVREVDGELKSEHQTKDPLVAVEAKRLGETKMSCLDQETASGLIRLLYCCPWGVQAMSGDMEGLVETSLNPGIVKIQNGKIILRFSVRSSLESAKTALIDRLRCLAAGVNAVVNVSGDYPGWAYRKNSPFRDQAVEVFEQMYGKKPQVEAIHAGLECGLLSAKLKDLECISIGPDMRDIHTTEEMLCISSVGRVWEYILGLLAAKQ